MTVHPPGYKAPGGLSWPGYVGALLLLIVISTACGRLKSPEAAEPAEKQPEPTARVRVREIDGMVQAYVPAGEFVMGAEANTRRDFSNKSPAHRVYLDAFWMDQTEVTNAMYARCVQAGKCKFSVEEAATEIHFDDPDYVDHPVVYVRWEWAQAYCQWAGGRLPSEAEWEKAARGTDERKYPWGNEPPSARRLNFNDLVGDTTPVGSYPLGASPYGILDLAGNVREWVADWFSAQYYQNSILENPLGPAKGQLKVLRGGSFKDGYAGVLATTRFSHDPGSPGVNRGFRCVSE